MDLPQPSIPHQMADSGAGRVARRTEVRAPSQNRELATLLRQARRWVELNWTFKWANH